MNRRLLLAALVLPLVLAYVLVSVFGALVDAILTFSREVENDVGKLKRALICAMSDRDAEGGP